jgi:hypothetical protein
MKIRPLVPALFLSFLVSLGACGGSDSSEATATVAENIAAPIETTADSSGTESSAADTDSAADTATTVGAGATPPAGAPSADQLAAARKCFEENGVKLPEGGLGGLGGLGASAAGGTPSLPQGVDPAALQKAFAACASSLPGGGAGLRPGGANAPDLSAFITCLRDNGVSVPDGATVADLPVSDPGFAAARETCAVLLPAIGANQTPTTAG